MTFSLNDALRVALAVTFSVPLLACEPDSYGSPVEAPTRPAPKFESAPSASTEVRPSTVTGDCADFRGWLLVTRDEVEHAPISVNWRVPREALAYATPAIQALAARNAALVNALADLGDGGAHDDRLARVMARALFDDSVNTCHFEPIAFEDAPEEAPDSGTVAALDGGAEKRPYGRLAPELIQREVRSHFGLLRTCYESGLRVDPNLQGTVATKFVIKRDGTVSHVEGVGSDLPARRVLACVHDAFRKLVFPRPNGGIVTVVYPIIFKPGD
ncbi:MAG TPA: AgmX/PglI C-terminal domain-containing protein [Polyangiaceae bacterium]